MEIQEVDVILFGRENMVMLEAYPDQVKAFRKVVPKGEKIDPKKWNDEMAALFDKREDMEGLLQKEVGDFDCVEVIDFMELYNYDDNGEEY